MRQFIAVIGNRNSGKSTIIKSLTGCPTSSFRGTVEDLTTHKTIYVVCSSPQEQIFSLSELRKALRTCVDDTKNQGMVMAIQPSEPWQRLSMEKIFQEVAATGRFYMHAFVLDPGRSGGAPKSANIAARLKGYAVKRSTLNGKRFAHINAQIINKRTGIIS